MARRRVGGTVEGLPDPAEPSHGAGNTPTLRICRVDGANLRPPQPEQERVMVMTQSGRRPLVALTVIAWLAGGGGARAGAQSAAEPAGLPPETSPADVAPAAPAPVASAQPDAWAGTVELYGLVPWVQSTTTVRGFEAKADLSPGQILNLLQFAASARASVEHQRLGVLVDLAYNRVGAETTRNTPSALLTGTSEVRSALGVYDFALRYRFGEREAAVGKPGDWSLIPYAGVRLVQVQLDAAAEVRGNGLLGLRYRDEGTLQRTWAQPLIGTQASLFLSPQLRLFARGDVGGFGLAGARDLSGNAQVGLGYAIGNSTDLNVSWRYQGIAWSNGADRATGFTNNQNGVEVGLKFFF